jgi:hypothetical protein
VIKLFKIKMNSFVLVMLTKLNSNSTLKKKPIQKIKMLILEKVDLNEM